VTFLYRDNPRGYLIADPLVGPEKAPTTIEKKRCCFISLQKRKVIEGLCADKARKPDKKYFKIILK
jgi:hypothetical protein